MSTIIASSRKIGFSADRCALHRGRVHTADLLDAHELIHAYVEGPRPPWIFVEGLADALTCGYGPWSRPRDYANLDDVSALTWTDLAAWVPTSEAIDLTYYRAGTQLVRYLVDQHGIRQVMQHYRSAAASTVPDRVNADFLAAFGEALPDAWSAALALDLPGGPCLSPFECSHDPIALGESWQLEATCGVAYAYRTLDLTEPTSLLLSAPGAKDTHGDRDSLDMLLACDGLTPAPTWTSFFPPRLATRLEPGKYALVLPSPERTLLADVATFGMQPACDAALAQPLSVVDDISLAIPRVAGTSYVALRAVVPLTSELQNSRSAAAARICDGCSPTRQCRDLNGSPQQLEPATMPILEVESATATEAFTLIGIRPQ